MIFLADFGNSRCKLVLVDDCGHWVNTIECSAELEQIISFVGSSQIDHGAYSSVINLPIEINKWLLINQITNIKSFEVLPFRMSYQTPTSLGEDRIAVVSYASSAFQNQDLLIIQAGTCITFDYVSSDATYSGGAISPGLLMRFNALHTFTAKLPLIVPKPEISLIGTNTADSINSGVIWGLRFEVEARINQFLSLYPKGKCLISGGDAALFENSLKSPIFAAENMVLKGLYYLLKTNS